MDVNAAIVAVRDECPNEYARTYATAAMTAATLYGTEGLRVQVQYILANAGNWRGERARKVKAALRAWLKNGKEARR